MAAPNPQARQLRRPKNVQIPTAMGRDFLVAPVRGLVLTASPRAFWGPSFWECPRFPFSGSGSGPLYDMARMVFDSCFPFSRPHSQTYTELTNSLAWKTMIVQGRWYRAACIDKLVIGIKHSGIPKGHHRGWSNIL